MVNKLSDIWMASYISNDGANFWIRSRPVRRCPPGTWTARIDSEYAGCLPHPAPPADLCQAGTAGSSWCVFVGGGGVLLRRKKKWYYFRYSFIAKNGIFLVSTKKMFIFRTLVKSKITYTYVLCKSQYYDSFLLCNDLTIQPSWLTHTCTYSCQYSCIKPISKFPCTVLCRDSSFNCINSSIGWWREERSVCNSTMNTESFLTLRYVTPSLRNCVKNKRCISWPFL